jgi:hypothetical protein
VRNKGPITARAARIAVGSGLDSKLGIWNNTFDKILGDIAPGGSAAFSFEFNAEEGIATGNYIITFISSAQGFTAETVLYSVRVAGKDVVDKPEIPNVLSIGDLSVSGNQTAGGMFTVSGTVRNTGGETAEAVTVAVGQNLNAHLGLWNNAFSKPVGDIAPGASSAFSFEFHAEDVTATGNYLISLSAEARGFAGGSAVYSVRITGKEDTAAPTPAPDARVPAFIIESFNISRTDIRHGDAFTVSGIVKNISKAPAPAAFITIDNGTFNIPNSPLRINLGDIPPGGTADFSFGLTTPDEISTGSHRVSFTASSYDWLGLPYEVTYQYPIRVTGKAAGTAELAEIVITEVTVPQGSFDVDEQFSVMVTVTNRGAIAARNVTVAIQPRAGIDPLSLPAQTINSITPGESRSFNVTFAPNITADSRFHVIDVNVDYEAGVSEHGVKIFGEAKRYGGVSVINTEKDKQQDVERDMSRPKIIVSNYAVDSGTDTPEIVLAGQGFDLFLEFQNTHASKTVQNIQIRLSTAQIGTDTQNIFSVVGGSNTIFIAEIGPGEFHRQTLRMESILAAQARNHNVLIEFIYDVNDGTVDVRQEERIGVTVTQDHKLEIGNIWMPGWTEMGRMEYLWFSLQNTGRVTIFNVKVFLEGEGFDVSQGEVIMGNLRSGDYQFYDGGFSAFMPGTQELKIIVQYDLDTGKRIVEEFPYYIEVGGGWDSGDYFPGDFFPGDRWPPESGFWPGDMGWSEDEKPERFFPRMWYNIKNLSLWIKITVPSVIVVLIAAAIVLKHTVFKKRQRRIQDDFEN